jgi:hypothetical protein
MDQGLPEGTSAGEAVAATEGRREAPAKAQRLAQEIREGRRAPTMVAGLIAWSITVAPVGFGRGGTALAGFLAVLSLAAGLGGPILLLTRPRLGRHVGISLFVGFAMAAWLVNGGAIHPLRLEPIRGAFGAIAWGVFAVSWSDRWSPRALVAPPDPEAPALLARTTLAPLAAPIAGVGVAAGVGYLIFAFQIRDPDRALLAQALALVCAVVVVSTAATVATIRSKHRSLNGRRLSGSVVRALLFLVTFALAGAIVTVLR